MHCTGQTSTHARSFTSMQASVMMAMPVPLTPLDPCTRGVAAPLLMVPSTTAEPRKWERWDGYEKARRHGPVAADRLRRPRDGPSGGVPADDPSATPRPAQFAGRAVARRTA